MIKSSIVEKLKGYAEFWPVCPEVGIGLGVPRDPVRVVDSGDGLDLFQPNSGRIFTDEMEKFSESFLESTQDIDGFILKNKSPSCGVKAINIYTSFKDSRPRKDGIGLFAKRVMEKYPNIPVEDEGRLRNLLIRENFLSNIFTIAKFRQIKSNDLGDIIKFHTQNKLLLMSHSPSNLNKMGKILSNNLKNSSDIKTEYEKLLLRTLAEIPRPEQNINVLMHAMGYFSKDLKHDEKSLFLSTLDEYKEGRIPLLVTLKMLKMWIIHFDQDYLSKQTFFEPYPQDLMQITFI